MCVCASSGMQQFLVGDRVVIVSNLYIVGSCTTQLQLFRVKTIVIVRQF